MADQTPELGDFVLAAMETRLAGLFTAAPGVVMSYDATRNCATIQPLVSSHTIGQDGGDVYTPRPAIQRVPIVFPGGKRGRITYPIAAGDGVLLVFCSQDTSAWKSRGGMTDPDTDRRHHQADAIAIPGLFDFGHVPTDAPTNASVWHSKLPIKLGSSSASDAVALKSDLTAINTAIDAAITALGVNPAAAALAALQTALGNLSFPVCSAKVSVDS